MTGIVKRLVSEKGFGFIAVDGERRDLFFHRTALRFGAFDQLREGTCVTFDEGAGPKGPRAENVRVGD